MVTQRRATPSPFTTLGQYGAVCAMWCTRGTPVHKSACGVVRHNEFGRGKICSEGGSAGALRYGGRAPERCIAEHVRFRACRWHTFWYADGSVRRL